MSQAFVPGLQVSKNTVIKKRRELPIPGKILVKEGDLVKDTDTVGRAFLPGELYLLRLPEQMGIEPFEVIKGLKVKKGDVVKKGDLLCEHAGLFGLLKSRAHAPATGEIELITERTGHLGLRETARPIELDAYLSGKIVSVDEGKSVVIETRGSFIQGIFGVGGERKGKIKLLDVAPEQVLSAEDIPDDNRDTVLVGGTCPSAAVLQKAAESGARGFVTGAVDDQALAGYLGYDLGIALTGDEDLPMTLILTEGFGEIPMSLRTVELLRDLGGRRASINGATQVRAGALRPEIIVPDSELGEERDLREQDQGLTVGRSVRLIRVPYFGLRATVVELPHAAEKLETGAFARVLKAKLESGEIITVPRANVELV